MKMNRSVAKMICPMKQFFSYLGASLAAIAALASCNKELEAPVEDLKGGVPFEICASTADTKTAVDGLATSWVANDAINLFHAVAGTDTYTSDGKFTISAENLDANKFKGTLNGGLTAKSYVWYAIYPYNSNISTPANTGTNGWVTVGGTTQTQEGNDSMAHLCGDACPLYGVAAGVASNVAPKVEMKHLASIIEVNVTNNSGKELTVSNIAFTGSEDIVGTYFINFVKTPVIYKASGANYVSTTASLTVSNGDAIANGSSAKFYIAVKPFTATAEQTLNLSVNGYSKDIPHSGNVTFTAGKIKKVNFDFDKVQTTYTWGLSVDSTTEATEAKIAWTNDVADMVCAQGEGGTAANNYYPGKSNYTSTRFYSKSTLSITPKTGKSLTYYVFEATTAKYATALANSTWTNAVVLVDDKIVTVIANDPTTAVSAVIGDTCGFTKVECHTDPAPTIPPVIKASPMSFSIAAAGDVCTIKYSIDFPVDGKSISATSNQDWVNNFDYSTAGEISFVVDENTGDTRSATITLSYEGAESVNITVAQNGASSTNSKTVEFIAGTDTSTGTSLSKEDVTITITGGTLSRADNYRVYAGKSMTISVPTGNTITRIETVEVSSSYANLTADGFTRDKLNGTWIGASESVKFSCTSQSRITKITVTYE